MRKSLWSGSNHRFGACGGPQPSRYRFQVLSTTARHVGEKRNGTALKVQMIHINTHSEVRGRRFGYLAQFAEKPFVVTTISLSGLMQITHQSRRTPVDFPCTSIKISSDRKYCFLLLHRRIMIYTVRVVWALMFRILAYRALLKTRALQEYWTQFCMKCTHSQMPLYLNCIFCR